MGFSGVLVGVLASLVVQNCLSQEVPEIVEQWPAQPQLASAQASIHLNSVELDLASVELDLAGSAQTHGHVPFVLYPGSRHTIHQGTKVKLGQKAL